MKHLFNLCIGSLLLFACNTGNQFNISGSAENLDSLQVTLIRFTNGAYKAQDSAIISNGQFTFKGAIDQPELVYLTIKKTWVPVFVESGALNISLYKDSLQSPTVLGSASHLLFANYEKGLKGFNGRFNTIYENYDQAAMEQDSVQMAALREEYQTVENERNAYVKSYIDQHLETVVATYLAFENLPYDVEAEGIDSVIQRFDEKLANSMYIQRMQERATKLRALAVGGLAPDFAQKDTSGVEMKLSELRGNYVMIDFWASWCGPCREENPAVLALYNEYKDQGFEIIGVSLDTKEAAWKKAIKDDRLPWYHVSDLKGWENSVGQQYAVNAIPHTILLDKEGKIIAKNLRSNTLKIELEKLFTKL